jgi:hypothetical protein
MRTVGDPIKTRCGYCGDAMPNARHGQRYCDETCSTLNYAEQREEAPGRDEFQAAFDRRELLAENIKLEAGPIENYRCWIWQGPCSPAGYGGVSYNGGNYYAHRLFYILYRAVPIRKGFHVMHACDNPPCCNPSHLKAGTAKENTADSIAKGRRAHLTKARRGKWQPSPTPTMPPLFEAPIKRRKVAA